MVVLISAYRKRVALVDTGVAPLFDRFVHLPLHPHVHPPVRMDEHLFLALVVDETQLVPVGVSPLLRAA